MKEFQARRFSISVSALAFVLLFLSTAHPQSRNFTSLSGTVTDPTGAVIPGAAVEIQNPVSQFQRKVTTDSSGAFNIPNIPFAPYHLTVTQPGFASHVQDVNLNSPVAVNLKVTLQLGAATQSVTVSAGAEDLIETDSTFHSDVDRSLIEKLPVEGPSSSMSSIVAETSPGVVKDSDDQIHPLGEHADNQFSVDGQAITDQTSKMFSNQIPADSIQSMQVISGAPPAEFGDKTSVVIQVTTRSGMGVTQPHGSLTSSYGSFGTANAGFDLAYGGANAGNYISVTGLNSGKFLDAPEFAAMHDKGNEENVFDRVDFKVSNADTVQLNLAFTRSWFQVPNSFDQQFHFGLTDPLTGLPLGHTDQRAEIKTFNISPSWNHVINTDMVSTFGVYVRRDQFNYYPSGNPFNDISPIQSSTVAQDRTLTNAGVRGDVNYTKGIHNVKVGGTYNQTFLNENDTLGIVDPNYLASNFGCPNGNPAPDPCAVLPPFDLTRRGTPFTFKGHTDVKELGIYAQDAITKGQWQISLGIRGDFYNGLTTHDEAEPRLGVAYNVKRTNTVLRASYARVLDTPFNENLIVSSEGCGNVVLNPLLGCSSSTLTPLQPGWRNEFHAGLEKAFGKYLVASGEFITKYTHNAYDFSILGNTPITFPIAWTRSKIPGYAGRISVPNLHGFTALVVMSSVAARFFTPQVSGAGATPSAPSGVFRIDHDEKFNETTHLQYQFGKTGPWFGFNWRYDSGLVAGNAPCYGTNDFNSCPNSTLLNGQPAVNLATPSGRPFTADEEFEAGLFCGSIRATPTIALPSPCLVSQLGSTLISIPAAGTENDDRNPPRIARRSLFDMSAGDDNLFRGDRYKWSLQLTAINIANKRALYNFLSTFSGTHYVTPRALTGEVGFHF